MLHHQNEKILYGNKQKKIGYGRKHPGNSLADHPRCRQWNDMAGYDHPGIAGGAIFHEVRPVNDRDFDSFFVEKVGRE